MRRREAVLDLYNAVLGAALLLSPWLFALTRGPARVDAWAVGAAIILLSLGGLLLFAEWETWIVLACGMWLVASPWLLGFVHTAAMRVNVAIAC